MHEEIEPPTQYAWVVYAVAMLMIGGLTGYVLSTQMNRPGAAPHQKSLAINATHGQTLFNVGIVRADGKSDYAGAVAEWDTLLKTNPQYPDVPRVQTLMAEARQKAGVTR